MVDVLIVGAGLTGLALAPTLAHAGLEVAITDRVGVAAHAEHAGETDDGWDTRIYAISPGSAAYLRSIGVWQALSIDRLAPVESMRVAGDEGSILDFSAYEQGERALAWIVEERSLRAALVPLVHATGVTIFAPRSFASITWGKDWGELRFDDGERVRARLVVGADGIRSKVREAAGIGVRSHAYGQTGVVANFICERAHQGRAFQWFLGDGSVLAWLPLPGRRISIVWSAPLALAEALLALDPEALSMRVAAAGGHALGALQSLAPATGFPLAYMRPAATIGPRVALIGDAAHVVHPLAGQGVNLGFGDAAALAAVLRDRGPVLDPGAPILLERYARRRVEPVLAMLAVTDGLAQLFGARPHWVRRVRNLGLAAVDRLPFAKRFLAQSALR